MAPKTLRETLARAERAWDRLLGEEVEAPTLEKRLIVLEPLEPG